MAGKQIEKSPPDLKGITLMFLKKKSNVFPGP